MTPSSQLTKDTHPEASAACPQLSQDRHELQAERTIKLAPIVKSYLELVETDHCQGRKYTATWDQENRLLSLVSDNQLKMLAQHEGGQWRSLPVPLTRPNQPSLTQGDLEHFETIEPRISTEIVKKSVFAST